MGIFQSRPYDRRQDFLPIREFLGELRGLLPAGQAWDVRRWDGANCHTMTVGLDTRRAQRTRIWESDDQRIVAVALYEGGRQIHPHVHPEFAHLADDVIAWAEQCARDGGDEHVMLLVWDHDLSMERIAIARGYEETPHREYYRTVRFGSWPIPHADLPDGYSLRSVRNDAEDHQRVADLVNAAFGRTSHVEEDHRAFVVNAPSYREHMDLAVIAPDGSFATYGAVNVDEANGLGIFEPIGTHPDHRQRSLAQALMLEGMHRASELGLIGVEVSTGDLEAANTLYDSLPFSHRFGGSFWHLDLR